MLAVIITIPITIINFIFLVIILVMGRKPKGAPVKVKASEFLTCRVLYNTKAKLSQKRCLHTGG